MKWYLLVLRKYADFNGRASRTEFWMYTLFSLIFGIVAIIIDNIMNTTLSSLPYGWFYLLYGLATLLPGIAVTARRLHDIGKSGWMQLIIFIPLIGAIWLLVLCIKESDPGTNEYGPNPFDPNPESLTDRTDIPAL